MKANLKNIKYLAPLVLLMITGVIWYAVYTESRGTLRVAFLNVGQGDAIFIESPTHNQILLDGGPGTAVLGELGRVMPFYDRSLDAVMMSHPNLDHFAGFIEVLRRYSVGYDLESGRSHTIPEYTAFTTAVAERGVKKIFLRRGTTIDLGGGAVLIILSPEERDMGAKNLNDTMVVARLVYGKTAFLLTGDMEKGLEARLVKNGDALSAQVLKVGHHGSKTSSSEIFLQAVRPEYSVIEVGKNSYGHPTQEILTRLATAHSAIFRTDTDGTIIFESDGENVSIIK
jgi:competence protein ComEC